MARAPNCQTQNDSQAEQLHENRAQRFLNRKYYQLLINRHNNAALPPTETLRPFQCFMKILLGTSSQLRHCLDINTGFITGIVHAPSIIVQRRWMPL